MAMSLSGGAKIPRSLFAFPFYLINTELRVSRPQNLRKIPLNVKLESEVEDINLPGQQRRLLDNQRRQGQHGFRTT
jgi:hypothetical protein